MMQQKRIQLENKMIAAGATTTVHKKLIILDIPTGFFLKKVYDIKFYS